MRFGTSTAQSQVVYLQWLANARPKLYRQVMKTFARGGYLQGKPGVHGLHHELNGLGWLNELVQAVASVGTAVMQKKQIDTTVKLQNRQTAIDKATADKFALLEINTRRAQSGLPPVNMDGSPINPQTLPMPLQLLPFAEGTGMRPPGETLIPGVPNNVVYTGGALAGLLLLRALKVF